MTKNDVTNGKIKVSVYSPGTFVRFINAGLTKDGLVEEGLPSGMIIKAAIMEDLSVNYMVAYWDSCDIRREVGVSDLEFVVLQ